MPKPYKSSKQSEPIAIDFSLNPQQPMQMGSYNNPQMAAANYNPQPMQMNPYNNLQMGAINYNPQPIQINQQFKGFNVPTFGSKSKQKYKNKSTYKTKLALAKKIVIEAKKQAIEVKKQAKLKKANNSIHIKSITEINLANAQIKHDAMMEQYFEENGIDTESLSMLYPLLSDSLD
jgi:hypothetical protein